MTRRRKILISAPYMLRERAKIELMLSEYDWDVTWARVDERLEEDDLLPIIGQYEGIVCGDDRFTASVYDAAKELKVIVKWGTGIDSINVSEANRRGIKVFRTPGAFTNPVADSTLSYILAFARNLSVNDYCLKNGGWDKPQSRALNEVTVGIIGFGAIGQAVASRLRPFGARVLAYDVVTKPNEIVEACGVSLVDLETLLRESNFVTLHCDLNPTSFHILKSREFDLMTKLPAVINTARGPLIKEIDLVNALNSNQISGAALDVFEVEPLPLDSPLRNDRRVFLAAHNSNSSPRCWDLVHSGSLKMLWEGLNS